ncbi:unnamed protein product, partial [Pleuronectes platessa]
PHGHAEEKRNTTPDAGDTRTEHTNAHTQKERGALLRTVVSPSCALLLIPVMMLMLLQLPVTTLPSTPSPSLTLN